MNRKLVVLVLLPFVLLAVNQCSKSPLGPEADAVDMTAEIEAVSGEIDGLHLSVLAGDDSVDVSKKLEKAIKKLEYLVRKSTKVITEKGDEEAQTKLQEALAAIENAKALAEAEDFENGFEAVQEGIAAIKEAFSAVTGKKLLDKGQTQKLKELRKLYGNTEKLLKKTRRALRATDNERAVEQYKRARAHLDAAQKALRQHKLDRAEWNIKEARKLAKRALKIVTPAEAEP